MNPESNTAEPAVHQHSISLPVEALVRMVDLAVTTALWALLRFLCIITVPPTTIYIAYQLIRRLFLP